MMKGLVTKPQATLTDSLRFIKIAAKEIGQARPPINDLAIGMLSSASKQARPRLKVKAAESRHLLSCVNWLLQNLWAPNSQIGTIGDAVRESFERLLRPNLFVGCWRHGGTLGVP